MSSLFDKYKLLQVNFKKYKKVVEAIGETDDATLKKMLETSKQKIKSTAEDLKKALDKIAQSNDADPDLKSDMDDVISKLKEKAPKASFGPLNQEVKVVEDPHEGLIVYSLIQYLVKEGDKSLYLTAFMKRQFDKYRSFDLWFSKIDLDTLLKEMNKSSSTIIYNTSVDHLAATLAKRGFTTDSSSKLVSDVKKLMDDLHFAGQDSSDKTEMTSGSKGKVISRGFRHHGFFESRIGEEDDDYPIFAERNKVLEIVKSHFHSVADKVKISVGEDEKGWFTVSVLISE